MQFLRRQLIRNCHVWLYFQIGKSDPSFPIQKKRASREFLRTKAHLRARTNTFGAVWFPFFWHIYTLTCLLSYTFTSLCKKEQFLNLLQFKFVLKFFKYSCFSSILLCDANFQMIEYAAGFLSFIMKNFCMFEGGGGGRHLQNLMHFIYWWDVIGVDHASCGVQKIV